LLERAKATVTIFSEPYPPIRACWAVFLSWFLAQLFKILTGVIREKRLNLLWIFDTGGMPSSHTSTVASLATAVCLYYGAITMPFLITLVFTIIIMFDAVGVRRSVGRQAQILNKISEELNEKGHVEEGRVKELLGHTPIEVLAGAAVGIVITLILCKAGV
jgi:hypothetical protein